MSDCQVSRLQATLAARDLSPNGTCDDLVRRLLDSLSSANGHKTSTTASAKKQPRPRGRPKTLKSGQRTSKVGPTGGGKGAQGSGGGASSAPGIGGGGGKGARPSESGDKRQGKKTAAGVVGESKEKSLTVTGKKRGRKPGKKITDNPAANNASPSAGGTGCGTRGRRRRRRSKEEIAAGRAIPPSGWPKNWHKMCSAESCCLHASFGFVGGRREFCSTHQVSGMINLVVARKKMNKMDPSNEQVEKKRPTASAPTRKKQKRPHLEADAGAEARCDEGGQESDKLSRSTPSPVLNGVSKTTAGNGPGNADLTTDGGGGGSDGDGSRSNPDQEHASSDDKSGEAPTAAATAAASRRRAGHCFFEGCTMWASFGFPLGRREFCRRHQREGMINLPYQGWMYSSKPPPGGGDGSIKDNVKTKARNNGKATDGDD